MKPSNKTLGNIALVHAKCASKRQAEWRKQNKKLVLEKGDYIKMAFNFKNKIYFKNKKGKKTSIVEHMWVCINKCSKDQKSFQGTLSNDPVIIEDLKYGDTVKFKRSQIEQHSQPSIKLYKK